MSRWFRHYAGMMRDDKLVRVSIKSKQPIERVLWVWGAILESAAEMDTDGRYSIDIAEVARFLAADPKHIRSILKHLGDAAHVHDGQVTRWSNRQFKSDKSAERVARHRAKSNGDVTLQKRHSNAPETETETEKPSPSQGSDEGGSACVREAPFAVIAGGAR